MKQQCFGYSDTGRVKKENEDAILMAVESGLYVLCDGCGGHAAGKIASKMTCSMTYEAIKAHRDAMEAYAANPAAATRRQVLEAIESGVNAASARVWQAARSDPDKQGMATTVVVLTILGNQAVVAHAGDSRLYLVRDGQVHQLTEDHTMGRRYVKMGLLTPQQARREPSADRLLRAVGFFERVRLETLHFELIGGDVLLLCSDGLTAHLSDEELAGHCAAEPAAHLPRKLVELANRRGGADNTSVIAVRVESDDRAAAEDLHLRIRALHSVPMFRSLKYVELLRVLGVSHTEAWPAGAHVVREGEPGDRIFLNLAGGVDVVKKGHVLAELPPGSLFGEMGFLDETERSADVIARENVRALVVPRRGLLQLLRRDRTLAVRVLWGLCRVLNQRLYHTSQELLDARTSLADMADAEPIYDDADQSPLGDEEDEQEGNGNA